MTDTTIANTSPETVEVPSITINDLSLLKEIIEIASARGAFKPNEMVAVGQTYNKLSAFLQQVTPKQEQAAGETNNG